MRITVTGGAGFIGSHVAGALVQAGHQVLVIDDLSSGRVENLPPETTFARVDLRNAEGLLGAMVDFRPQLVCHQAAQVSVSASTRQPAHDAEINVIGALNLFEACVRVGVERVVFASTGGAIYGEVPEEHSAGSGSPLNPLSPYGCAKLAVEHYLRYYQHEHGLASTILRYANVYGPRQDPHGEAGVVAIFCSRLLRSEPIQVNARKRSGDEGCVRDYVFVGDVVKANLAALQGQIDSPVVNVGTGRATSTLQLARVIADAVGVKAEIGFGPRRAGDLERSVLDGGELESLGPTVTLARGIEQTVAWFKQNAN